MSRCRYVALLVLSILAATLCAAAGTAAIWLNPRLDLTYHIWNTTLIFAGWATICLFFAAIPNDGCTRPHGDFQ